MSLSRDVPADAARRYVVCQLRGVHYAFEASHVRRAVLMPTDVGGEVTLSGRAYPVLDLRCLFGLGAATTAGRVLLLVESGSRCVALAMDGVGKLISIGSEAILPLPAIFRGVEREWFAGVALIERRVVVVARLDGILDTLDRRRVLAGPPVARGVGHDSAAP